MPAHRTLVLLGHGRRPDFSASISALVLMSEPRLTLIRMYRLHQFERFAADNVVPFGCQWGVQRNYLALAREWTGVGVIHAMLPRPIGRFKRIEGQHLHAEASQDLRGNAPDLSGANDTGCLALARN